MDEPEASKLEYFPTLDENQMVVSESPNLGVRCESQRVPHRGAVDDFDLQQNPLSFLEHACDSEVAVVAISLPSNSTNDASPCVLGVAASMALDDTLEAVENVDGERSTELTEPQERKMANSTAQCTTSTADTNATKEWIEWDDSKVGLGRRYRQGRQPVWVVQWRNRGQTIRRTLGAVDQIDIDQARKQAKLIRTQRFAGLNKPVAGQFTGFEAFSKKFLSDCRQRWTAATVEHYEYHVRTKLVPFFRNTDVGQISRAEVHGWFEGSGVGCNYTLSVLSSIMDYAIVMEVRPDGSNPCKGLRRKETQFRAHYPTASDYKKIGKALAELERSYPDFVAIIRSLALTGARRSEILDLKWAYVEGNRAVLPDSKTGPKTIWLPPAVRTIISNQKRTAKGVYVFLSKRPRPLAKSLSCFWQKVRTRTGLKQFRVHDLRHGFAATAAGQGESLRVIAALLGHRDFATTLGYAHLADQSHADAAQRVSAKLAKAIDSGPRTSMKTLVPSIDPVELIENHIEARPSRCTDEEVLKLLGLPPAGIDDSLSRHQKAKHDQTRGTDEADHER